jgi:hypothetical protein
VSGQLSKSARHTLSVTTRVIVEAQKNFKIIIGLRMHGVTLPNLVYPESPDGRGLLD